MKYGVIPATMMIAAGLLPAAGALEIPTIAEPSEAERWIIGVYEVPDVKPGDTYHTSAADDLGPAGRDDKFGYGRVDAAGAVF